MDFKDGSSDSDSSGVLNNEDCSFHYPPLMPPKSHKKPKPTNQKKNQRQQKQSSSSPSKKGNQFESLAKVVKQDDAHRNPSSKGKSPGKLGGGHARKISPLSNHVQNSIPPVPTKIAANHIADRPISSQNESGRGGIQSARQGKGRASRRGGFSSIGETSGA
nr:homeobox-leucine zipper protein ATHB-6-like [Ipomoea batatas]